MINHKTFKHFYKFFLVFLMTVLLGSLPLIAGEKESGAKKDDHSTHQCHAHHCSHHHNHHLALFNGFTSNQDKGHTDYTLGVDYEYRLPFLHQRFGAGFVGEIVFAEHQENIAAASLYYHPFSNFKMNLSAGYVFVEGGHGKDDHHDDHHSTDDHHSDKTESVRHFLTRVGTAYDFHVAGFSFGPAFNLDFIEGHTYMVFGISVGKGF